MQLKGLPMRSQVKGAAAGKLAHPMINPTLFASHSTGVTLFPTIILFPTTAHLQFLLWIQKEKQFKRETYASHF